MSCTLDKSTQSKITPNSSSDKQHIQLQDKNTCLLDAKPLFDHDWEKNSDSDTAKTLSLTVLSHGNFLLVAACAGLAKTPLKLSISQSDSVIKACKCFDRDINLYLLVYLE
mmetsp:Transcript_5973/g.37046  ORF Transcript_5973/g.37046 Transcript_5973/m.37046 type:complete len:111 (+) Transcript_5973:2951-3283(+)